LIEVVKSSIGQFVSFLNYRFDKDVQVSWDAERLFFYGFSWRKWDNTTQSDETQSPIYFSVAAYALAVAPFCSGQKCNGG
jgi:hypothetical protein